jgi:hypothetical protein
MVTIVRRLFGVRTYENRSYEISSCHIAKALRELRLPTRSASLKPAADEERPRAPGGRIATTPR